MYRTGSLIDMSTFFNTMSLHVSGKSLPKVFIQCTGDYATFKENNNSSMIPIAKFKVEVFPPVLKLDTF